MPAGELDPDYIHTPAAYVDRIVKPPKTFKPIEKFTFFKDPGEKEEETNPKKLKT